jgi:hypothetical protein
MRINNNPAAGGQGEGNRYRAGLFYLDAAGLISVSLTNSLLNQLVFFCRQV